MSQRFRRTIRSTAPSGLSPVEAFSRTLCDRLNADLLDGKHAADLALAAHVHDAADVTTGQLALARGGSAADLSATGGANQFVRQSSVGGALTVSAIAAADIDELLALADLTDVTAKTGTGTVVVMDGSPTITTPTIASLTNAQHNHQNAAGGGTLDGAAIASGTVAYARQPTGIVASTVAAGDDPRLFINRYRFSQFVARFNSTSTDAYGGGSVSTGGTIASADDSDGIWHSVTTAAAINSLADVVHTSNIRTDWLPDVTVVIKTPSDITNLRMFFGLSTAFPNNDNQASTDSALFRFSTAAGDTAWATNTANGAANTTTTGVAAFAASTVYRLRIQWTSTTSINFYVNDVLVRTETGTVPDTATNMTSIGFVYNLEGVAKNFKWSRFGILQKH